MEIQIQTDETKVDDIILDKMTNELEHLKRFYERIERCHVILKKEKSDVKKNFVAEVRLAVPGKDLFAVEKAESFERAITKVTADLKAQLIKHKEKAAET